MKIFFFIYASLFSFCVCNGDEIGDEITQKKGTANVNLFTRNKTYDIITISYNSWKLRVRDFKSNDLLNNDESYNFLYMKSHDFVLNAGIAALALAQFGALLFNFACLKNCFCCCCCCQAQTDRTCWDIFVGVMNLICAFITGAGLVFKATYQQDKIPTLARDLRFSACAYSLLIAFNITVFIIHFNKFTGSIKISAGFSMFASLGIIVCATILLFYDIGDLYKK